MHQFLLDNRADLIERCKAKVAKRASRAATPAQLANGIPIFIDQLTRTLGAQENGRDEESARISGASGGDALVPSEIGVSAAAHGGELLHGLRHGATEAMFRPFTQAGEDRTGLGIGLAIARRAVEADGGTLNVRDVPRTGCVFTLELPQRALHEPGDLRRIGSVRAVSGHCISR